MVRNQMAELPRPDSSFLFPVFGAYLRIGTGCTTASLKGQPLELWYVWSTAAPCSTLRSFGCSTGEQLGGSLRGLVLLSAGLPQPWERVVALGLSSRPSDPISHTLYFEAMGRYGSKCLPALLLSNSISTPPFQHLCPHGMPTG